MNGIAEANNFNKGIIATLAIVVGIMTVWSIYTQSNRFTYRDGERHEVRMAKIEEFNSHMEQRYDKISDQLIKIETLIRYKLAERFQDPNVIGRKFQTDELD